MLKVRVAIGNRGIETANAPFVLIKCLARRIGIAATIRVLCFRVRLPGGVLRNQDVNQFYIRLGLGKRKTKQHCGTDEPVEVFPDNLRGVGELVDPLALK